MRFTSCFMKVNSCSTSVSRAKNLSKVVVSRFSLSVKRFSRGVRDSYEGRPPKGGDQAPRPLVPPSGNTGTMSPLPEGREHLAR